MIDKSSKLILFEDIQNALQPLIDDKTIYSVEIFNAQTDFESKEIPRQYPYISIDFTTDWQPPEAHNGNGELAYILNAEQKGMCVVTVHHVFSNLEVETTSFEQSEPIRHCVHRYLQEMHNPNYYTKLLRRSDNLDTSHNRVFDYITQYQCMITELAIISDNLESVTDPTLVINRELVIDNEIVRTAKDFE